MKKRRCVVFIFLVAFWAVRGQAEVNHWETPVFADSTWNYFVGVSAPPSDWYTLDFNDRAWLSAKGPFGYGKITATTGTVISSSAISVFMRKSFTITDTSAIEEGLLSMDYDDAFVAYLNGVEIGRSDGLTDAHPAYNTLSSVLHDAIMVHGLEEQTRLSKATIRAILKPGKNVFCVQVHNKVRSSDVTAIAYLSLGINNANTYFQATPDWLMAISLDYSSSNLPIVKLQTHGQSIVDDPKITADFGIIDNGPGNRNGVNDPFVYQGPVGIELRGQTSLVWSNKKCYGFETRDELGENFNTELLGMPKENDWILYSEFDDNSMLRNTLIFELGNRMGRWAPRTRHCELYLNDKYRGVYELMEKIKKDDDRVDISTLKSTDNAGDSLTGGYIIKIDKGWIASTGFTSKDKVNNKNLYYTYVYPDADEMTTQQKTYIKGYIDDFESAISSTSFDDPVTGYAKYIDVASFVDYFLINELSKNIDAYRLSTYLHKDKDSKGGKLVAGPLWDYNYSLGCDYGYDSQYFSGWMFAYDNGSMIPGWWKRLYSDLNFQNQLKTRWNQLRENVFNYDSIASFLDQKVELLTESSRRDFATWPRTVDYGSLQGEVDYMKNWIAKRLVWIDQNLLGTVELEPVKPTETSVSVWPNPFVEQVHFRIESQATETVQIQIFDLTGRLIHVIQDEMDGQDLTTSWDGQNSSGNALAQGIYVFKVLLNDKLVKTGKLIHVVN